MVLVRVADVHVELIASSVKLGGGERVLEEKPSEAMRSISGVVRRS